LLAAATTLGLALGRASQIEPITMELSTQLKQASHDLHGVAEKSGLMAELLRGQLSRRAYTLWLLNLQAIYTALEAGLALAPARACLDCTPLYRASAIAQDLAFLEPSADMALCEAAMRYVARLQELSAQGSRLLLAHAYVRYLGDLHGGQLLRRTVARLLQSDGAQGLAFYDFGTADRVAELIQGFRAGLNALALDGPQAQAMAQEARLGFGLHIDMFLQLPQAPLHPASGV
jgi:heme oxygenase